MSAKRPQKPSEPNTKLLERIERQFDRLTEKLDEVEAMLPDLPFEEDAANGQRRRRRTRKPK